MARTPKVKKDETEQHPDVSTEEQPTYSPIEAAVVSYEDLIVANVKVQDKNGNLFYLDPARKQGEFVLRVVPKPTAEVEENIPAEWIKPTADEVAANSKVIDWGMPPTEEPATAEEHAEETTESTEEPTPDEHAG